MRFWRSAPRIFLAASLVTALPGCDGARIRPGPPELTLTGPANGTVYSPDTLGISLHAADANGLDSISVGYLGQVIGIDVNADTEKDDVIFLFVPEGLSPGQAVVITGVAIDLTGETTRTQLSLTVAARP